MLRRCAKQWFPALHRRMQANGPRFQGKLCGSGIIVSGCVMSAGAPLLLLRSVIEDDSKPRTLKSPTGGASARLTSVMKVETRCAA